MEYRLCEWRFALMALEIKLTYKRQKLKCSAFGVLLLCIKSALFWWFSIQHFC
jgi:hypothetical protein